MTVLPETLMAAQRCSLQLFTVCTAHPIHLWGALLHPQHMYVAPPAPVALPVAAVPCHVPGCPFNRMYLQQWLHQGLQQGLPQAVTCDELCIASLQARSSSASGRASWHGVLRALPRMAWTCWR